MDNRILRFGYHASFRAWLTHPSRKRRQEEELSDDSDAYDLSAFPELVEMCRKWTYTLEELKAMGLLEKEDE
jgi:hypothetical protein